MKAFYFFAIAILFSINGQAQNDFEDESGSHPTVDEIVHETLF